MAVKYKIEFESNAGVKYRVDIYDPTYSGTPIELQGGATPFTTEEDNTDDFFAPIRTSTGTLSIINGKTMAGDTIDIMEEVVPANNTEKAVRLMKIVGNTETVEWQGFLSCEAYEQEFTDQPREVSINCNSCLGALESVKFPVSILLLEEGIVPIIGMVAYCLNQLVGVSFRDIYLPQEDKAIWMKKMNMVPYFSVNEIRNESTLSYELIGENCKEILSRIATFMGWCIREYKGDLVITRIGGDNHYYKTDCYNFIHFFEIRTDEPMELEHVVLDDYFEWNGENHSESISAGYRRLEVISNVPECDIQLKLPEFNPLEPHFGDWSDDYYSRVRRLKTWRDDMQSMSYYNIETVRKKTRVLRKQKGIENVDGVSAPIVDVDEMIPSMFTHGHVASTGYAFYEMYIYAGTGGQITEMAVDIPVGAMVGSFHYEEYDRPNLPSEPSFTDCLLCAFVPSLLFTGECDIVKIKSPEYFAVTRDGSLEFSLSWKALFDEGQVRENKAGKIHAYVRFGNKYWSGSSWVNNKTYMEVELGAEGNTTKKLPVTAGMAGGLEIGIHCMILHEVIDTNKKRTDVIFNMKTTCLEVLFTDISITYKEGGSRGHSKNNENHYLLNLNNQFHENKDVKLEISSDYYNHASDRMIMSEDNDDYTYIRELEYVSGNRRPEYDLLDRMDTHYGAAKRKLTLQVEHPTEPLPLLRVTDGGKTYIPVAESRDYAEDSSELTLLEV